VCVWLRLPSVLFGLADDLEHTLPAQLGEQCSAELFLFFLVHASHVSPAFPLGFFCPPGNGSNAAELEAAAAAAAE